MSGVEFSLKKDLLNNYTGYKLPSNSDEDRKDKIIPTIDKSSSDAESFYEDYVSKRKPCIFNFQPEEISLTMSDIEKYAGDEIVQVEKRENQEDSFGKKRMDGKTQIEMSMNSFLSLINDKSQDSSLYYLSTQEGYDDDNNIVENDEEELIEDPFQTAPCKQLRDANVIPSKLNISGNMVLNSANLWLGSSSKSSSGLHHDYHDNFYFILQGSKRFRLYSPDCAQYMDTNGKIDIVFENGRISYVGQECNAAGVPIYMAMDDEDDDSEKSEEEEEEEEIVLGKGCDYDSSDDDNEERNDDVDDYDEMVAKGDFDDDESNEDDDNEEEVVLGKGFDYESSDDEGMNNSKKRHDSVDDFDELMKDENDDELEVEETYDSEDDEDYEDIEGMESFSKIVPSLLSAENRKELEEKHPLFAKYCSPCECIVEVHAGQAFYLPAGWFHEVTSMPADDTKSNPGFPKECHAALNYWYHPPDELNDFSAPYQSDFWSKNTA